MKVSLSIESPCTRTVTLGKKIFDGAIIGDGVLNVEFDLKDFSPRFKKRDFDLITSEKIKVLPKNWLDSFRCKRVEYLLNGHLIEAHRYQPNRDYNFLFDLAPTPKPDFQHDLAGLWYNDRGKNTFTIRCGNPFWVKSIFLYRAYQSG